MMDEPGNPLAAHVEFPLTHEELWSSIGRAPWVFCHPAVMYRRDAAIEVGLYRPDFQHAEDTEFFARLMSRYRAANLPDVVLNYRLRRTSISLTKAAHGRVNAELVATIIDRWQPGEPFEPTTDERIAADMAIAACGGPTDPGKAEVAYQLRVGRELLRGKQWKRAFQHYLLAAKQDRWNRLAYAGMVCAIVHYGGATQHPPEDPVRPSIRVKRINPQNAGVRPF